MTINWNTEPYNDDYNEDKKFYRILFRPGFAVQARELTQLQTILQKQISRHGDAIFKQGAMVIPGEMSIDTAFNYIKLQTTYGSTSTDSILDNIPVGTKVVGGTSGVTAEVLKVAKSTETNAQPTLYVRYTNSGTDTTTKKFVDNEVITTDGLVTEYNIQAITTNATGIGSAATILRGVYYVNGNFVLVDSQTILLDYYNNNPSYRIGLQFSEKIIVPEDDETLLDNAQSSYNFAAPGAHRYYIDLILSKVSLSSEIGADFIELMQVDEGVVKKHVRTTEYSVLEKTLARRTYDESGNYTVRPFDIDVREYRNNNRGTWASSTVYLIGDVVTYNGYTFVAKNEGTSGSTAPTPPSGSIYVWDGAANTGIKWEYSDKPSYNRGVNAVATGESLSAQKSNESKLSIGLEPGKAYVQGYEIEKIATEFVTVDKARTKVPVQNAVIPVTVGNYVLVTNVNNLPRVASFDTVGIYDQATISDRGDSRGKKIGTARVRFIEWDNGTIGDTAAVYKLGLFDVKLNAGKDFNRDVKSFYADNAGGTSYDFSADTAWNIPENRTDLIGSVTTYTTAAYTTAGNGIYVKGNGTSFQTDLKVGDYVIIGGVYRRVVSISGQGLMTINGAVNLNGATIKLVTTQIKEPGNSSLIFPFPYYAISNVSDTIYSTYFSPDPYSTTAASGGYCTLSISAPSGSTFASAAETDNYLFVDQTTGDVVNPYSINVSGSSLTVTFTSTYANREFRAITTINKNSTLVNTAKTKTLTDNSSSPLVFSTQATATASTLLLGKADIYRIVSIKMKTGTFASPGSSYSIDISDRYMFDDGQRDSYYDLGRLSLKPSYAPPTAPVQIIFEYFTHSPGDYFTSDSYVDIDYKTIPSYAGKSLRDCIDFRPRINDAGTGFTGTGAQTSLIPKRGIDVTTDFNYYLPRKDKIAVDLGGNFFAINGVPSLIPGEPSDPSLGMILYKLTYEPYTFGTASENVVVDKIDNKRFTMRDIGRLEKRIDNLEYYTSLSLLEQETKSMDVLDSDGLDRFKNGFIVDSFTGHGVGDVYNPDYMCSVDMESGELRPFASIDNVNLIEKYSDDNDRSEANYKLYGDVITLPLDSVTPHVAIVNQPYASRLENVNPFAIFTFIGDVKVTPSSDDWFETERRPDIIQEVEGDYTTIKTLAEKAGVLGTIWNAWQTQWTGTPVSQGTRTFEGRKAGAWVGAAEGAIQLSASEFNARFGNIDAWNPFRRVVLETTAAVRGESRTGVKTNIVAKIDRRTVEDRVLSTAIIPYIRSRYILIQAKGLKPNSRFYPWFDDIDISSYVVPPSKMTYTLTSGNFDFWKNVGGNVTQVQRRIDGDTQICLNKGDVIYVSSRGATNYIVDSSPATAVVIGVSFDSTTNTRTLDLANVKGTFLASDVISGSESGATGVVGSITVASQGGTLTTTVNGDLNFLFKIPNTDAVRFRTGIRELKLLDVSTNNQSFTSIGRAQYRATGVLETKQSTIVATRNAELVQEQLVDNRVIVETSERVVADTGWYDPLAQTFLIQSPGGAFLSKVDLYFATKDEAMPVRIELREVVNGFPGKNVLPFSRVTKDAADVNISTNTVVLDGIETASYDTATTFEFPSPVYVQDNTEYAIVIMSDSNKYKVWISNMGDTVPGTSQVISQQPYAGVFFKSQNASTWTADQMQDLKFTIYRAKFNTDVVANVEFINDVVPYYVLDKNPIQTNTGTNKIRVLHRDHGMPVGSYVTIDNTDTTVTTGATGTGTITTTTSSTALSGSSTPVSTAFTTQLVAGSVIYTAAGVYVGVVASVTNATTAVLTANAATAVTGGVFKYTTPLNGIPTTQIYKTHQIDAVDIDSYTVTVTSNATSSGRTGGSTMRASHNIAYDAIQPIIQSQSFSETVIDYGIKTITGQSVDAPVGTQTPYSKDSSFSAILANENNYFDAPRLIASEINETNKVTADAEGLKKSLVINATMSSTNDALTPVIDTHRVSAIAVSNKLTKSTETNVNISELDTRTVTASNTLVFTSSVSGFTITNVGSGYTSDPTVTITPAVGDTGFGATAIAAITVDGTLESITITNPGYGYAVAPTVTISAPGSGTTATATAAISCNSIASSDDSVVESLATVSVGNYITVTGSAVSGNNSTWLVTGYEQLTNSSGPVTYGIIRVAGTLTPTSGSTVTIVARDKFVDEIAPFGSTNYSKYVSKRINLAENSRNTFLKIRFAACIPSEADIEVYYKVNPAGSSESFDTINYTKVSPVSPIVKTEVGTNDFTDVDYSLEGLTPFDAVQVKLVMLSTNTSAAPRVRDLRIIVCE